MDEAMKWSFNDRFRELAWFHSLNVAKSEHLSLFHSAENSFNGLELSAYSHIRDAISIFDPCDVHLVLNTRSCLLSLALVSITRNNIRIWRLLGCGIGVVWVCWIDSFFSTFFLRKLSEENKLPKNKNWSTKKGEEYSSSCLATLTLAWRIRRIYNLLSSVPVKIWLAGLYHLGDQDCLSTALLFIVKCRNHQLQNDNSD